MNADEYLLECEYADLTTELGRIELEISQTEQRLQEYQCKNQH